MLNRHLISYGRIRNRRMHPHRNRGLELVLVEQGHLEWQVENQPESLFPGSLFFTLPWQAHGSRLIREPENRIIYFLLALPQDPQETSVLSFPDELNCTRQEAEFISEALLKAHCHARTAPSFVQLLFSELLRELDNDNPERDLLCAALFKTLLLQTACLFSRPDAPARDPRSSRQNVLKILTDVRQHLDEEWTLDTMANRCGMKRTRFATLCRELTGYTPLHYLSRLRFEQACQLLRKTKKSITDITFDCGYSSSQYFAAQFKKSAGMTPTEYRRLAPDLEQILSANWLHPEDRTLETERLRLAALKQPVSPRSPPKGVA